MDKKNNKIFSIKDLLTYEIYSHTFASKVSNPFLQKLMAKYFAWKVTKKYRKYVNNMLMKKNIS